MQLSDVLIHLDQAINETEKENIIEQLRAVDGVIAPRFNKDREHLLLVSYNSDRVDSLVLLNEVRDQGYQAQLVGL
ncbi:MAG: hypothetical protein OEZ38_06940 [Gammaproteobacteria bacterium]|nr:hypothetical protein [Gammaproteobacteria bacterium]